MNADGSDARKLTPGPYETGPIWSPDGTEIAYRGVNDPEAEGWVYVIKADGNEKRPTTQLRPEGVIEEWRPPGLTYHAKDGVRFVDPDGGADRLAIKLGAEWQDHEFSPDGERVALSGPIKPGGDWELGLRRVSGGEVVRLTDNDREDLYPSWAPDGKSLVFQASQTSDPHEASEAPSDIYVMNEDGSGERNLTESEVIETGAAWAPR
jgi:Tol biopolymer transport system component